VPDYNEAQLAYSLLKDYHYLTVPALKALRAVKKGEANLPESVVQTHRLNATGWFNHLAMLVTAKYVTTEMFLFVATKQAARLWLEYVAPLDRVVRGEPYDIPSDNPVEKFWRDYVEGGKVAVMKAITAVGEEKKARESVTH
jgi:hypothetical protein